MWLQNKIEIFGNVIYMMLYHDLYKVGDIAFHIVCHHIEFAEQFVRAEHYKGGIKVRRGIKARPHIPKRLPVMSDLRVAVSETACNLWCALPAKLPARKKLSAYSRHCSNPQ